MSMGHSVWTSKMCESGSESSCTDVHDEQHSGQPSVSAKKTAKVEQEMPEDRHVTICELCEWICEPTQRGRRVL